jgi:dimethylargininase
MSSTRFAIVRPPTASFVNALGQRPDAPKISLAKAVEQHGRYCDALSRDHICIMHLPGDDQLPDGCFVEDTAIVLGDAALVTRPGAPSRRPEVRAVSGALADLGLSLLTMGGTATLDGGDVLRVGRTVFIGRSARTNDEGAALMADFATARGYRAELVQVPHGVLHLKCHVTALDDETVLAAPGWFVGESERCGLRRVEVPEDERYAANVLALRSKVLVPAGFVGTAERIEQAGFTVEAVDTSQFALADGSLTCLSVRIEPSRRRTRTMRRPRVGFVGRQGP